MSKNQEPEKLAEATLTSHLLELRTRLFRIVIAFVILLALTGAMSPDRQAAERGIAALVITIIAALLSPTSDALSLAAMALPMWLLFEGGIVAARILVRIRDEAARRQAGHRS